MNKSSFLFLGLLAALLLFLPLTEEKPATGWPLRYTPLIDWGLGVHEVMHLMKGHEQLDRSDNELHYRGRGPVLCYSYLFSGGRLVSSAAVLDTRQVCSRTVTAFDGFDKVPLERDMFVDLKSSTVGQVGYAGSYPVLCWTAFDHALTDAHAH